MECFFWGRIIYAGVFLLALSNGSMDGQKLFVTSARKSQQFGASMSYRINTLGATMSLFLVGKEGGEVIDDGGDGVGVWGCDAVSSH